MSTDREAAQAREDGAVKDEQAYAMHNLDDGEDGLLPSVAQKVDTGGDGPGRDGT